MSTLNRTTFDTTYVNSSGTFADNTTRAISEGDLRQFSDDIVDSFLTISDDISFGSVEDQTESANKATAPYAVGSYITSGSISSAAILTGNSVPVTIVAAPGSGLVIIPIKFFVFLDYNSAAYATNTTFNFLLHLTNITNDNTTMLSGTADRYASMTAIDFDTTTNMANRDLSFKVQTGDPTAGNSPIYYSCIYRIVSTLPIA